MPQRRTSIKSLRVSQKRHLDNLDIRTDLKKTLKRYHVLINQKNIEEAKANLPIVYKKIDKAAKRHILSKNTASRRKSLFSRLLSKLNPKKS